MSKLSLFAFLLIATTAHAEIIFQPSSLERGDRYRLIFVTSDVRNARSKDIEDYNDFVQGVADAAPIIGDWGLEWKALASTPEVNAIDNLEYDWQDLLPFFRIDGTEATRQKLGLIPEFFFRHRRDSKN